MTRARTPGGAGARPAARASGRACARVPAHAHAARIRRAPAHAHERRRERARACERAHDAHARAHAHARVHGACQRCLRGSSRETGDHTGSVKSASRASISDSDISLCDLIEFCEPFLSAPASSNNVLAACALALAGLFSSLQIICKVKRARSTGSETLSKPVADGAFPALGRALTALGRDKRVIRQ